MATKKQLDLIQSAILSAYCTNFIFEELLRQKVPIVKHSLKNKLKNVNKELLEFEKRFFDDIERSEPQFEEFHHKITSNMFEFLELLIKDGNKDLVQRMQLIFAHQVKPKDMENLAIKILTENGQQK